MGPDLAGLFHLVKRSIECGRPCVAFHGWLVTNVKRGARAPALQKAQGSNRKEISFLHPRTKRGVRLPRGALFFFCSRLSVLRFQQLNVGKSQDVWRNG